ncbi:MAG: energy transducer TonB [Bacteroidales bacterium]|jgi:protein TonB|nr:energy transducer TonB [Bacteroidales bacterium]
MELKKSDRANLEKRRGLFIEIGLLVALAVVFVAFEWSSAPSKEMNGYQATEEVIEEEEMMVTRQETPPPPPPEPPRVADILAIVDNSVQVNTDFSIDMETDQNQSIEIVQFQETVKVVEEEEEEVMFAVLEDKPMFNGKPAEEGFREYVGKNTIYPPVATENGVSGKVIVEFLIEKDGSVSNVKVLRGVDPSLDAEAVRVIKASPKWTPGKQRGKTVKVKYQFPVNFKLTN